MSASTVAVPMTSVAPLLGWPSELNEKVCGVSATPVGAVFVRYAAPVAKSLTGEAQPAS